jgi:hypothetical protein
MGQHVANIDFATIVMNGGDDPELVAVESFSIHYVQEDSRPFFSSAHSLITLSRFSGTQETLGPKATK